MKFFRRLSLILALLLFELSSVIVLLDVLGDYHIIINNFNSNQILAVFSVVAVAFFLCYFILGNSKKLHLVICTVLMVLTLVISLYIGFMPQHRYTEIVSEDGKHTMIVEEKTTSVSIYIRVYEKVNSYLCYSKYAVTLSEKKFGDSYQYGDFYIVFEEHSYNVYVPLYSKSPTAVPYHKSTKTSD